MAQYYCQTDKVLGITKPADTLAAATAPSKYNCSPALSSGRVFSSLNNLDGFKCLLCNLVNKNVSLCHSLVLDFLSFGRKRFVFG